MRTAYRPLRPDLDGFLFSRVEGERGGIPLSMISALTQLGLDPWEEAARLSSLTKREAIEQLARLLAELPDASTRLPDLREIAGELIERLPKFGRASPPPAPRKRVWTRPWSTLTRDSRFYVLCVAVAAALLLSIALQTGV